MKPTTPRKKSLRRSSRKSSRVKRMSSKSPNYHTHSNKIPLKKRRTSTRSINKRISRRSSQKKKKDDSFELLSKSGKKKEVSNKRDENMIRNKFQIISNDVEIDEDMIQQFKNNTNCFKTDYLIFGIIGTQSTGKSTLLNSIFECNFDMLDSKKGRKQTTKGIWGSFIKENRLLILDIEGSDSMERSIIDQNAENKICTFGLVMTHVLFSKIIKFIN